jgi:imidazolonepropionase
MNSLAVLNCAQVVTPPSVIPDGALLAVDGRIELVAPRLDIESRLPPDTEVVDAGGRVLLPGFVDAHTHAVFAGNRADEFERRAAGFTYQQIAAAGGGIRSTVRKTRAATDDDLYQEALRYQRWFHRCGTTTVEAKSGYGLSTEAEMKMLRVIRKLGYAGTFLGAHETPDEFQGRTAEYVDLVVREMLPQVAAWRLAEYCDVFCEPGVFDVEQARRILVAAREHRFKLRLHADQLSRSGGAELAAELGAATADHLEHTDERGIAALAAAGVQPVLLPGSVYALGSRRYPAARAMLDAGLALVLATDFNPGSSPTPSLPMVMSIACTQMKMSPMEALLGVTVHAARSLGRAHELGSLEAGKRANFVLHDCADYRELAYWFGVEPAYAVYVDGALVYSRA